MADRLRVLVVDDEPAVVETTAAILSEDFAVAVAADGAEALAALGSDDFDVLCTDFNMPGANGLELIREAVARHRFLATVLVTGYREYATRADRGCGGGYLLLVKPYQPAQLVELVTRAGTAARMKRRLSDIKSELRTAGGT